MPEIPNRYTTSPVRPFGRAYLDFMKRTKKASLSVTKTLSKVWIIPYYYYYLRMIVYDIDQTGNVKHGWFCRVCVVLAPPARFYLHRIPFISGGKKGFSGIFAHYLLNKLTENRFVDISRLCLALENMSILEAEKMKLLLGMGTTVERSCWHSKPNTWSKERLFFEWLFYPPSSVSSNWLMIWTS